MAIIIKNHLSVGLLAMQVDQAVYVDAQLIEFLAFPLQQKRLHRPGHRQSLRLPTCQYRLQDLRRQQRDAEHAAGV